MSDGREDEISWLQVSEMNATLQIPSLKKVDPSASRGGSTFQNKDPSERVEKSGRVDFPLEEKALLETSKTQSKLSGKAG